MDCFCLLIFDLPGNLLLLLYLSFIFWCISIISRSYNQPVFIIVLTWSASLCLVVWKLESSCQIPIILFLYPLCVGLLQKLLCSTSWLFSRVYAFCLVLWLMWFLKWRLVFPEKRKANISMISIGSSILDITGTPADHDTQVWGLIPTLCNIWIWYFIMGGILWLYQTKGLFIICATDTGVTDDSHCYCSLRVGHKKKKNIYQKQQIILSFNLVNVHEHTLMIYSITGIWTNFRHSSIIFLFCIYCPFLEYFPQNGNVWINIKLLIIFRYTYDGNSSNGFKLHQIPIYLDSEYSQMSYREDEALN